MRYEFKYNYLTLKVADVFALLDQPKKATPNSQNGVLSLFIVTIKLYCH